MRPRNDAPIIPSLLDIDSYKFTMGQLVYQKYPSVPVRYGLRNRTKTVNLAEVIPIEALREQLDHARTLRFTKSELDYLDGTKEYQRSMFTRGYIEFFDDYQLPSYELSVVDGDFQLEFTGPWSSQIYWETIALAIINELYYRYLTSKMNQSEFDCLITNGLHLLEAKIKKLKDFPEIKFMEFGTRRRFAFWWQERVIEILAQRLPPTQFLGTSNTYLAKKFGIEAMGTSAHELFMVLACLRGETDAGIFDSTNLVLDDWWELYGQGLSIALPDTFGSDYFFRNWSPEKAQQWKGTRQDSGDPFEYADKVITFYHQLGIDSRKKMLIFSDGLDVDLMIELWKRFHDLIQVGFGWGTNLTNDLGLKPLSLVIKVLEAAGRPAVKLSDNIAKALGEPAEVERYKQIFGYTADFNQGVRY